MKAWFSRFGSKETEPPEKPKEVTSEIHTSLAINVLFHHLESYRKAYILDLGPALGENVEFFSQFSCKLFVEDLYSTLGGFDYLSEDDGFSYDAVFGYLLPFPRDTRFDVILSWDLINYLEKPEFSGLVQYLRRFCHSGTVLLALVSTLKHIPESPFRFRIVDPQNLHYENFSNVLRPSPRYQQTDLNQMMPGFRVCNSFILRNGIKEYLFAPK